MLGLAYASWLRSFTISVGIFASVHAEIAWQDTAIMIPAKVGDETIVFPFAFEVIGDRAIRFLPIETGCGCAMLTAQAQVYQPKEHGVLRILFRVNDRLGPQDQAVIVKTDLPDDQGTELRLRTDIPTAFDMKKRVFHWLPGDSAVEQSLDISVCGEYRISTMTAMVAQPDLDVAVETIRPGERYRIRVVLRHGTTKMPIPIRVATDHPIAKAANFILWSLNERP